MNLVLIIYGSIALPVGVFYCIHWWKHKAPDGFNKNLFKSQKILITIGLIVLGGIFFPLTIRELIIEHKTKEEKS